MIHYKLRLGRKLLLLTWPNHAHGSIERVSHSLDFVLAMRNQCFYTWKELTSSLIRSRNKTEFELSRRQLPRSPLPKWKKPRDIWKLVLSTGVGLARNRPKRRSEKSCLDRKDAVKSLMNSSSKRHMSFCTIVHAPRSLRAHLCLPKRSVLPRFHPPSDRMFSSIHSISPYFCSSPA